jgi:23S rRNA (guanosine2251-2'-O)-methyltransferase
MFLYGRNSILKRLEFNPQSINKIYLDDAFSDTRILNLIKKNKVFSLRLSRNEILRKKRVDNPQGIIAEVDNFSYTPLKELINKATEENSSIIVLDSISDPQNLGAILRTCACFGGFSVVIPKHDACEVNETVLHVASGGDNFVPISLVSNISTALIEIKKQGFWVAGAIVEGGQDLYNAELLFPVCLLLGSEGKGIRQGLQNHIDLKLTLPMQGADLSFNVAIACAIFCNEIVRQREASR